ncbi:terpenoid synthase [Auricularia subglabra TFB-10046 SS5]|nr:terpenoid synthase [Auricularia subglabra TFB-10046 SS5]
MANEDWVERVRAVMTRGLHSLDMTTPTVQVDARFYQLCYDTAVSKGYTSDGWMCITPYLEAGVAIAQTSYPHLENMDTRVWIALWTGFLVALDDTYAQVPGNALTFFLVRVLSGQKQPYPNLERFATHLHDVSHHVDDIRAALVLTATFNFLISLRFDGVLLDKELPRAAGRFPSWSSLLSGLCEGYAMFAFPLDIPFDVIAPAVPDMQVMIRNYNDVFSYYKEEKEADTSTHISLLAKMRKQPKLDVLDAVTNDAIVAHQNVCEILAGSPRARDAWVSFARGFAEFHYASKRYLLQELQLD